MRFRVPAMNAKGEEYTEWLMLKSSLSLEEAIVQINGVIGCTDLPEESLPSLFCHFSKDKQSTRWDIRTQWDFIKKDYLIELQKKGQHAAVEIILPSSVSMKLSLYIYIYIY